jgi:hypothetical protein
MAPRPNYEATNVLLIPIEFILFGLMLLGVAILHERPLLAAAPGLLETSVAVRLPSPGPLGRHHLYSAQLSAQNQQRHIRSPPRRNQDGPAGP